MSEVTQDWRAARDRVKAKRPDARWYDEAPLDSGRGHIGRPWTGLNPETDSADYSKRGCKGKAEGWLDADRRLQEGSAKDGEPDLGTCKEDSARYADCGSRDWTRSPAPPAEYAVEVIAESLYTEFAKEVNASGTTQPQPDWLSLYAAYRMGWRKVAAKATSQAHPVMVPETVLEAARQLVGHYDENPTLSYMDWNLLSALRKALAELQEVSDAQAR